MAADLFEGPPPERPTYTPEQLAAEMGRRFGPDPAAWAFRCPHCGDVATVADWREAIAGLPEQVRRDDYTHADGEPYDGRELHGQMCIGRLLGALSASRKASRGCDWTAFGLFGAPGGIWVEVAPGCKVQGFPIADAPRKEEG